MRLTNRQEVMTLIFEGVVNRVIIGQEPDGTWSMYYLSADGGTVATIRAIRSREEILRQTKESMRGHGRQVIENLIDDSEKYLGSMNLQPKTTNNNE